MARVILLAMTGRNQTTINDTDRSFFRDARQPLSTPPARPWRLVLAVGLCIAAVIVGSLGPWMTFERVSDTASESWTLYGGRTDGTFGVLFATVAIVALAAALVRPGAASLAWVAVGAMVLCSLIGLFDWMIFDPMELTPAPGERGAVIRVEWGLKLLSAAAPVGALSTFLVARRLTTDV